MPSRVYIPRWLLYHGSGVVINWDVVIGGNFTLRHSVAIGDKFSECEYSKHPIIADNIDIKVGIIIIWNVTIRDNPVTDVSAMITKDVELNSIIVTTTNHVW